MKPTTAGKRKLPRSLVTALILVMSGVSLGCILMLAAAQWDRYVLFPIGAILMAAGCVLGGMIVVIDRSLPALFRALGTVQLIAGIVAIAATIRWVETIGHRL